MASKAKELCDELTRYLSTDPEQVIDVLQWWMKCKMTYPIYREWLLIIYLSLVVLCLHYIMTSAYTNFAATSTDVECVFSCSRLLLSHVQNCLSLQSIQALMCLGSWSWLRLVKDKDIHAVTALAEIDSDKEELAEGWDSII